MRIKYKWNEWFSQEEFTIQFGTDYIVSQSTMIQQIRNAAHVRGISVNIKDTHTGFRVKVTQKAGIEIVTGK